MNYEIVTLPASPVSQPHPLAEAAELRYSGLRTKRVVNIPVDDSEWYRHIFGTEYEATKAIVQEHEELSAIWRAAENLGLKRLDKYTDQFTDPRLPQAEAVDALNCGMDRLIFNLCDGRVFETTCALDLALQNTDIGGDAPWSSIKLPFPHVYVRFGEGQHGFPLQWEEGGFPPELGQGYIDGLYIKQRAAVDGRSRYAFNFTARFPGRENAASFIFNRFWLEGSAADTDSVETVLSRQLWRMRQPQKGLIADQIRNVVYHTIKILLYVNCAEPRQELVTERTTLRKELQQKGQKKQAKATARLARAYDRIRIGPLQHGMGNGKSQITIGAHWRRGHFRRQAYGPGLQERRLIWIEPVLVNAQNLAPDETTLTNKVYRAVLANESA